MRLFLLSTVSTAALIAVAVPAMAGDNMTGVAGASVGFGSTSNNPLMDDPTIYNLGGKGYWTLSPDVHLQADVFYEHTSGLVLDNPSIFDGADSSLVGGAIHLLHPVDNRARVGIVGSIWNVDVLPIENFKFDKTYGLAALEGQFFGTDWTLTAQGGFISSFDNSANGGEGDVFVDSGTYLRGEAKYFLYDNTAVSLETTQLWGKIGSGGPFQEKSLTSSRWVFEIEHKFDDSPFAGIVSFDQEHDTTDLFGGADVTTASVGVKFYLDQPTLKSNDRTGAELDTPNFGRALGGASAITFGNVF